MPIDGRPASRQIDVEKTVTVKLSLIAIAVCAMFAQPALAQQLTFMTGPQGSAWVPLSNVLAGIWEKGIPGLSIKRSPGARIANVRGVDEGKAQIALASSNTTVLGLQGKPPYPKQVTKVCQLGNLYPEYFQMVALADANVDGIADLKGKSLVTQPKGNAAELMTELVLRANGMTYQSLSKIHLQAGFSDAVSMMKDGRVQVFTLTTTVPTPAIVDLATNRDIRLVPVDDKTLGAIKATNSGHSRLMIKAGTYPKQDRDIPAIGHWIHVVVACDMPETVVYNMARLMAAVAGQVAGVNEPVGQLPPEAMALDVGVPLHEGAAMFYRQVGAI